MPPKGSGQAQQPPVPDASADPTRSLPFAYTSFFAPPPVNAKNVASQYVRNDTQTWSGRNGASQMATNGTAALSKARKRRKNVALLDTGEATPASRGAAYESEEEYEDEDGSPGPSSSSSSNTIVIHAGSRHLRIGLSTDLAPIAVPHILARRDALTATRGGGFSENAGSTDTKGKEEEDDDEEEEDGHDTKEADLTAGIDVLRSDLKSIMRNMKLRPVASGRQQTANYNAGVKPETLAEHQDVFAVDWSDASKTTDDVMFGEKALRLDSFSAAKLVKNDPRPFKLFQPFKGGHFNYEEYAVHYGTYACHAALLNDIQTIWSHVISAPKDSEKESASQVLDQGLGIPASDWAFYNVVLVIPDLYLLAEVESLVNVLLQGMGFAAVMVQQAGVCATFGAGLSSACVIHIGSEVTQVTCVDDGFVLADSRTTLDYGGDQISSFFMQLLERANFPYGDINLSQRLADRWLANELKERLCTMDPTQLGMAINEFHVRLPNKPTRKYSLRTYDEIIVGPMCLFKPRVLPFPALKKRLLPISATATTIDEEVKELDVGSEPVTLAMSNCVRHLLPPPPPPLPASVIVVPAAPAAAAADDASTKQNTPAPDATNGSNGAVIGSKTRVEELAGQSATAATSRAGTPAAASERASGTPSRRTSPVPSKPANGAATEDAMNVDESTHDAANGASAVASIDISYEASKVALDWAIWSSILASLVSVANAGQTEERMKRMSTNMFCTGGTALMPGVGMAIEARVHTYLAQWLTQQGKDASAGGLPTATVVPPPRDMDPRIVTWKGSAVMARLDGAQDMWVLRKEWQMFGMRALRDKAYFL